MTFWNQRKSKTLSFQQFLLNDLLDILSQKEADDDAKEDVDFIETTIIYMKDQGKRYIIDMNSSDPSSDLCPVGIFSKIYNARKVKNISLQKHGFELFQQTTSLSTDDFYRNPNQKIQMIYYKEIENFIKSLTNAEYVKAFEHGIRSTDDAPKCAKEKVGFVAHGAHCDFTSYEAFKIFKSTMMKDCDMKKKKLKGRFAIINVWRNISDLRNIQNYHLAVLDARSASDPDNFLKYETIKKDTNERLESYYLNALRSSDHWWYYFPKMHKNEIMVFVQYDSDCCFPKYTFHTAIYDPTYGDSKEFVRESIELRLIAYFPEHTPNTISTEY